MSKDHRVTNKFSQRSWNEKKSNDSWSIFKIMGEFVEGYDRLQSIGPCVSIFGSARTKPEDPYYKMAQEIAFELTQKGYGVITGGGPGIMEAANRGASEAGGPTIGMNISIPFEQDPNPYISDNLSFEFHYFFMRKFWFVYPAKALVVFPGGFGTFDELFELLTLRQTLKIKKPMCVVVYGKEFWESVVDFKKMVEWGVVDEEDLKLFFMVDSVDEAFKTLTTHLTTEFSGQTRYWHW